MEKLGTEAKLYISLLAIVASVFLMINTATLQMNVQVLAGLVFFGVLAVFTDILKVNLPRGGYVTVTSAVTFATMQLFGAAVAGYVIIFATVISALFVKEKSPWYKLFFNCSQFVFCLSMMEVIFLAAGGAIGRVQLFNIVPLVIASAVYFFLNCLAVTIILALERGGSPWGVFATNLRWALPNMFTLSLLSVLMVGIYNYTGYWGVSLFFIPLLLARFIFKSYVEVKNNYMDTLAALANVIDAKDKYTKGHSDRVAEYAGLIARHMRLPEHHVETIQHMAMLHDVGKIGITEKILCKQESLTSEEFDIIKQHSAIGAKIVESIKGLGEKKDYILYHHEKYCGGGYPSGISGQDIPLGARIISVADAFDAMTSDRSYRPRRSYDEAILELKKMSGIQFDPHVVKAFVTALEMEQRVREGIESTIPIHK